MQGPNKTKAALPGRQCQSTKLKPIQNSTLVDLVNMTEGGIPPSPNYRTVTATAGGISTDLHGVYPKLDTPQKYKVCEIFRTPHQPFGSIPRCCSSLRSMRLIQVARDESPSLRISSSSCERNSCANLIWYWSVFVFSLDIVITKFLSSIRGCNYNAITWCFATIKIVRPRGTPIRPRPLTKPLYEVTIMADIKSTQTRSKFTFLFLATPDHTPECAPVVLRFDADTEAAERNAFPGWDLIFAAKIRTQPPCRVAFFDYATRSGWEFDSASVQEVNHV